MRSQAHGHFPQVRFSDGQKWLFNPVLKKRFADRPEERVRLQYVEFLLRETSVTKNRIGFEALVKAYARDNSLRADLVIFDRNINPMALIECKSGRIKLNEKTAEQAARYNLTLQADYLMITNGQSDFWYKRSGQTVAPIQDHPLGLNMEQTDQTRSALYWIERGFLDSNLTNKVSETASKFLNVAFSGADSSIISYLNLPADVSPVPLNHFYRIVHNGGDDQLALSLVASQSKTLLAAMLNRDGQNKGVIWIPLADMLDSHQSSAHRLSPDGETTVAMHEDIAELFRDPSDEAFKKLVIHLINFFD